METEKYKLLLERNENIFLKLRTNSFVPFLDSEGFVQKPKQVPFILYTSMQILVSSNLRIN